jgi:histidyl-tRNA synthetase
MQALPGFRDFLPTDCAVRNYVFGRWREVARRYGFIEWDGPILEPTDLYRKKSGAEIVDQLFNFTDKGEREVALRPELTPTLARVVAAHEREFRKPLKWFSIGQFFRYEKQQRGRLREHFQLNCDIIGDESENADAELLALMIDVLRSFGFTHKDVQVYISHRGAWTDYLKHHGHEFSAEQMQEFLSAVDKLNVLKSNAADEKFRALGTSLEFVNRFISMPENYFDGFNSLAEKMKARGLGLYVTIRPAIVRGLAYYTGFVFEAFDVSGKFRAIAGGGRYDNLVGQLSDSAVSMPALGFAMGDVVLRELINETPAAREQMQKSIATADRIDIYVVIAKEERRANALAQIQELRNRGYRVDYPLGPEKVARQFQLAEDLGASLALLYGDEWPQVAVKDLGTGEQKNVPSEELLAYATRSLSLSS